MQTKQNHIHRRRPTYTDTLQTSSTCVCVCVYLVSILLGTTDDVLLRVDPVELLVQWVVVDGSHVTQAVNG